MESKDSEFNDFLLELKVLKFCDACISRIQKGFHKDNTIDLENLCDSCTKILSEDDIRGVDSCYRQTVKKGFCHKCAMDFATSFVHGRDDDLVAICEKCKDVFLRLRNKG